MSCCVCCARRYPGRPAPPQWPSGGLPPGRGAARDSAAGRRRRALCRSDRPRSRASGRFHRGTRDRGAVFRRHERRTCRGFSGARHGAAHGIGIATRSSSPHPATAAPSCRAPSPRRRGCPRDPVCGSAHLALVPFWSDRLRQKEHLALQLSPRGGELHCSLEEGEVRLAGRCALYMEGLIHI